MEKKRRWLFSVNKICNTFKCGQWLYDIGVRLLFAKDISNGSESLLSPENTMFNTIICICLKFHIQICTNFLCKL